jgi:lipoate-protein ligase A
VADNGGGGRLILGPARRLVGPVGGPEGTAARASPGASPDAGRDVPRGVTPDAALGVALEVALDEALLDSAGFAARVWRPEGTAAVVGVASRAAGELHLERLDADQVPVLRRFSGGAAVLLTPGVVCFTVVLPRGRLPESAGITAAYREAARPVSAALARLGVECAFERPGDLACGGLKVVGFAQARRRRASLVHGVVPVELDPAFMEAYLAHPPEEPAYRMGRRHSEFVASVRSLAEGVGAVQVERALAEEFGRETGPVSRPAQAELDRAVELARGKYATDDWTFRR